MKVRELIAALEALDMPDADVVTGGFDESGIDDVDVVCAVMVERNHRAEGHWGPHRIAENGVRSAYIDFGPPDSKS